MFSVVCTLVDNDKRPLNVQNVVDSGGAADWVHFRFVNQPIVAIQGKYSDGECLSVNLFFVKRRNQF